MEHDKVNEQLLNDKRVIEEIQRHQWIESEKAGRDIGFDNAKTEWLQNFSKAWMQYHMPEAMKEPPKQQPEKDEEQATTVIRKSKPKKSTGSKRRRAKSYLG